MRNPTPPPLSPTTIRAIAHVLSPSLPSLRTIVLRLFGRACRRAWLIVGALFVTLTASESFARGEADLLWTPITRREVDHFGQLLGCDHDQKAAIFTLFKGYRTQVLAIAEADEKHIKESRDDESLDRRLRKIAKYDAIYHTLDETDRLNGEFFKDLHALVSETQASLLPTLERYHRRHSGNRLCVSGAERLDLIEVAEAAGVARTPELIEALADYEERLDHLLIEKGHRIRKLFERVADAEIHKEEFDEQTLGEVLRLLAKGSLEIRDFQLGRARSIGLMLTDEERARWTTIIRERAWPRVYAFDLTGDALKLLTGVDSLTPEQKAAIVARHDRYLEAAARLGPAYVRAIDQWQEQMARRDVLKVLEEAREESAENALFAATADREKLAQACVEDMTAVLTADQRKALKSKPDATSPRVNEDLLPIGDGHADYLGEWEQKDDEEP